MNIITEDPRTHLQYRIGDYSGLQWFLPYTRDGAGFGYLSFKLPRRVGKDYRDIGHAYRITIRKGAFKVLFDGQISKITENSGSQGDSIEVYALGWIYIGLNDTYNRVYTDTRVDRWIPTEETDGSLTPDKFNTDTGDGYVKISPRRGTAPGTDTFMSNGDYSRLRYTFEFGETVAYLSFYYSLALPYAFPGKFQLWDETGMLAEITASGGGAFTIAPVNTSWVELRFIVTDDVDVTAEDGTVYFKANNPLVCSIAPPVTAKTVALDLLRERLSLAGHGLSTDERLVQDPGFDLSPCYFENDQDLAGILKQVLQYGDGDGNPWVWGVTLDDTRRFFIEPQDFTDIKYVVNRSNAELQRSGDWAESLQKVYGVYADENQVTHRTADVVAADVISELGGYYRRGKIDLNGITSSTLATALLALWITENARPGAQGTYTVQGGAWTPDGQFVPFDELQPGGLVQVREWRAVESTLQAEDYRDDKTTFVLAGVRVDYDNRTAELIPRESGDAFDRQMALIAQIAGR